MVALRELAARFGFRLRRKDQRPARRDAGGSVGTADGGGGVEAGGGEGCGGIGGSVDDTGAVCRKDSTGDLCMADVVLLRPRRKVGAGAGATEGKSEGAGEETGAGDGAREGAGAGGGAGVDWPVEPSCLAGSKAMYCSAGMLPGSAPQEVCMICSVASAFGPLDGVVTSTSVSVTISS